MVTPAQLISHRFRGFSPHENTIDGLNSALDFGVKQVEFDIRVTRCGTPLIYHDEAAKTKSGVHQKICDVMARDRTSLGGVFKHMPTAEALFEAAAQHPNKAKLLIDMKDAGFEDMLVALAKANGLIDQIVWVSWLPETLYAVRDLLPEAELTLSHWCQNPNAEVRKLHHVFEAKNGNIPRPPRRQVIGERSGWFVNGPLQGEIRDLVQNVCLPVSMVTRDLVENYQVDGIKVSVFSYTSREALDAAEVELGLDDYFVDAKVVFDSFN
ncbi:MAG: glycerophosphodiester phosphodiesterase family protein [Litorimonas sp.]